ncbi:MAG: hypothetical protein ACK5PS_01235 [Desulfopila sp.]
MTMAITPPSEIMATTSESIWILGYGKFGQRAVTLLTEAGTAPGRVTVIDHRLPDRLPQAVHFIQAEGVRWFIDNFQRTSDVDRVIPALPVHLAAEWVKARLMAQNQTVQPLPVPERVIQLLPNPYRISADTYALSHATFRCPDNCDEPEQFCTVTGKSRATPVYTLVEELTLDGLVTLALQSRQFAPGLGGFYVDDLWKLLEELQRHIPADILLCTACKCHGIVNGLTFGE